MKNKLIIFLFGLVLFACEDDIPTSEISVSTDTSSTQLTINDTIIQKSDFNFFIPKLTQKDTILIIDNESYTLTYSAKLDTTQKISFLEIYNDNGKQFKTTYNGYNTNYSITLKNNDKDEIVFTKLFTKDIFKDSVNNSVLTESDAYLPEFVGYIPSFNSFIFTTEIWVPESDVGSEIFFMLDRNGNIKQIHTNNYFGGGDCDGFVEISQNQDFVLTCRKIIHSNGRTISIADNQNWQVGTRLINENTILVIQEYNDTNNIENAHLINNLGKRLKSFCYRGYFNILGYEIPIHYDTLTKNYILLDEEQTNVRVINKLNPLSTYIIGFDEMANYDLKKKENEIVFDLNTDETKNTFSMNKLTNKFRHLKNR